MQYYKHFSNMRNDKKIKKLILKYGIEGYGWYNLILETITEKLTTDNPLPELEESCEDLALFYNGNTAHINEIVCFMVNENLFELNEVSTRICCNKIYKYLEASQTRSLKIKEMIKNYKKVRLLSDTVTDNHKQSDTVTVRKEKKRKEKNIIKEKIAYKDNILLTEDEYNRLCDNFSKQHVDIMIEYLSNYKIEKKYKSDSDNLTIRRWVVDACEKKYKWLKKEEQTEYQEPVYIEKKYE